MKRTAIVYMLDTSGSTAESAHSAARREVIALEAWLRIRSTPYVERFVVFDAVAHEIDRDAFLSVQEKAGGTMVSSALARCAAIIEADYAPADWDVFAVLFWDGDNWSDDDNLTCIELVRHRLLPRIAALGLVAFTAPSPNVGRVELTKDAERLLGGEPRVVIGLLKHGGEFAGEFRQRVESLVALAPGPPGVERGPDGAKRAPAKRKKPAPPQPGPKRKKRRAG